MPPAVEVSRPPFRLRGGRWSGGSRLGPLLSAAEPGEGPGERRLPSFLSRRGGRRAGAARAAPRGCPGVGAGGGGGAERGLVGPTPRRSPQAPAGGLGGKGGSQRVVFGSSGEAVFWVRAAGGEGCVVGRREDPCPSLCLWLLRLTLARSGRVSFSRHVYICCLMQ